MKKAESVPPAVSIPLIGLLNVLELLTWIFNRRCDLLSNFYIRPPVLGKIQPVAILSLSRYLRPAMYSLFRRFSRHRRNLAENDTSPRGTSSTGSISTSRSYSKDAGPVSVGGKEISARSDREGLLSTREHSKGDTSLGDEAQSIWEDIDPPERITRSIDRGNFAHHLQARAVSHEQLGRTDETDPSQEIASTDISPSPPPYNEVSGAVVVDWNGNSRFLSPEEEEERRERLQRAVRERMLGLPRRTDFDWARPSERRETLPKYSAGSERLV